MLRRLFIQNYALIEETEIHFGPNLNVLTGETGAGKSLLIGAIGMILGQRADTSVMIRPDEKVIVEAVFQLPEDPQLLALLAEEDIEPEGGELLIRRMITPSGKSRAFINDLPVTLETLRAIAGRTVSLHGQHQGQLLLETKHQRYLLDGYAGCRTDAERFQSLLNEYRANEKRLSEAIEARNAARDQEDYLRHQLSELTEAQLDIAEEASIEQELKQLEHSEEIKMLLFSLRERLQEADGSVTDALAEAERNLEPFAGMNPVFEGELAKLQQARYLTEEAVKALSEEAEQMDLEDSAERMNHLQERQDVYNRLKVKFNVRDASALIDLREEYADKLEGLGSAESDIAGLERRQADLQAALADLGEALESKRQAAAADLEPRVTQFLEAVGLPGSTFRVAIERQRGTEAWLPVGEDKLAPSATGINAIQFLISTNKGFDPVPLAKTASGGEISRVMLALKASLAERLSLAVLIFDEIDTGISGETARQVGDVMRTLATNHQVLAITHLPQIAAQPGKHFRIYKEATDGISTSHLADLTEKERVDEIASMLSGANPTDSARQSARELLGLQQK